MLLWTFLNCNIFANIWDCRNHGSRNLCNAKTLMWLLAFIPTLAIFTTSVHTVRRKICKDSQLISPVSYTTWNLISSSLISPRHTYRLSIMSAEYFYWRHSQSMALCLLCYFVALWGMSWTMISEVYTACHGSSLLLCCNHSWMATGEELAVVAVIAVLWGSPWFEASHG